MRKKKENKEVPAPEVKAPPVEDSGKKDEIRQKLEVAQKKLISLEEDVIRLQVAMAPLLEKKDRLADEIKRLGSRIAKLNAML